MLDICTSQLAKPDKLPPNCTYSSQVQASSRWRWRIASGHHMKRRSMSESEQEQASSSSTRCCRRRPARPRAAGHLRLRELPPSEPLPPPPSSTLLATATDLARPRAASRNHGPPVVLHGLRRLRPRRPAHNNLPLLSATLPPTTSLYGRAHRRPKPWRVEEDDRKKKKAVVGCGNGRWAEYDLQAMAHAFVTQAMYSFAGHWYQRHPQICRLRQLPAVVKIRLGQRVWRVANKMNSKREKDFFSIIIRCQSACMTNVQGLNLC